MPMRERMPMRKHMPKAAPAGGTSAALLALVSSGGGLLAVSMAAMNLLVAVMSWCNCSIFSRRLVSICACVPVKQVN
jgi:hypothetical protein